METLELIRKHPVYIQILKDSFGGVMYNVANRNKYDTLELVALWVSLSPGLQDAAGGIMKGAMGFIQKK